MKIDRKQVYDKCGGRCAYCGKKLAFKDMQVDHIYAKRDFDYHRRKLGLDYTRDDIKNLYPSCKVCNNWKKTFTPEKFKKEIEAQIIRLRLRSASFRLAERFGLVQSNNIKIEFWFETLGLRELKRKEV